MLVVDGLLLRRVARRRPACRRAARPGRCAAAVAARRRASTLELEWTWRVVAPTRLAILDARWTGRAAAYPQIGAELTGRALARSLRLVIAMAIAQQPKLDLRLWMLFWELADRYGKVHADGIHLELPADARGAQPSRRRPPAVGLGRADAPRPGRAAARQAAAGCSPASARCSKTQPYDFERGFERGHQVRDRLGALGVGLGDLDLAALALLADDRLQALAVLVVVVAPGPSRPTAPRSASPPGRPPWAWCGRPRRGAAWARGPRRGSAAWSVRARSSRTRIATRYSFVRSTKRPSAARSDCSITPASSR